MNILGFLTTTANAEFAVHLVVDNVNKAKKALQDVGLSYTEAEMLHVEIPINQTPSYPASIEHTLLEGAKTCMPA